VLLLLLFSLVQLLLLSSFPVQLEQVLLLSLFQVQLELVLRL
jgi:hypothetical protein